MAKSTAVTAWEALFRAQVAVMRQLAAEFPKTLSLNEYDVLFNLSRAPGQRCRLRDLTQLVLLTQPSISRLVDRLAARGLVEKTPDENDGRGTFVQLTPEGFEIYRQVAVEHAKSIRQRLSESLDAQELAELERLSIKLRNGA
ncbi:MarR family winged helix-turn-helix transcriptional regulator [Amnibacterium flavum]|uniref:MarR family transcriptional regulator n=1 Tax=Amnibacterium flavum TaxID=2173173 RepID=A0A2V1HWN5_9MICO|nr:MarR family transcriptional regulator [Amnibacterium flavum]PVZ95580.1 MarR family transcriptional regulator [Amnibacterium flavum]